VTLRPADATIQEEVTDLTRRLVSAPSPNPPGNEVEVQAVVREYISQRPGLEVAELEATPGRPIIVARLDTGRPGRTIVLCGHVDTVPVGEGWTHDPFAAEIESGRLYGRGACDMKAGVAATLVALAQLAEQRAALPGGVVEAHIVPDEEPGGELGCAVLLQKGAIAADAAIVAEPSDLAVFRAQKGNIFAAIKVAGRAAHGSMPERGRNAITAASSLIVDIDNRLVPQVREHRHELLGSASINVGTIHGGRRTNVVPDECVVTIDRRLMPGEASDEALDELIDFIGPRGSLSIEAIGAAFETPADHWLVRTAVAAVEDVLGAPAEIGGLNGSSDARFYADGAGIPTIILGPGRMEEAHVADEYVEIKQLGAAARIYERLVTSLLTAP